MKKLFGSKVGWFILLAAAATAAFFLFGSEPAANETARTVESKIMARGDITRSIAATGRVRALVTVEVGSQLSGKVDQLYVDFNDTVKKGDIVAEIDPQTFEQRVLQSSADLDSADANVRIQQATLKRAQVTLEQAKRDFARQEPLALDGAISIATLDATRTARDSAIASVEIAQAQIVSAKASQKQRAAGLANAQIDLERTKIKSPIDGVVIERNVDRGQTVAASLSAPILFKIAQDLTEIQIEANVDESDIGRVRAGNSVTFTVDAHEDQTFRGTVDQVRLSPTEINSVVTYTVIVNAANRRLLLLPGMTANLEIKTGERKDVLRLPNSALRVRASEEMKAQAAEASTQARRGNRRGSARFLEQMGVDSAVQDRIQSETSAVFQQMRGQMQQGGDRNALREMVQSRMQKIMKANLTDDQMKQLLILQQAEAEIRRAQVWVKAEDGSLVPVNVRLGIADDSYSEVVGGDLKEGADVVTRIRQARK